MDFSNKKRKILSLKKNIRDFKLIDKETFENEKIEKCVKKLPSFKLTSNSINYVYEAINNNRKSSKKKSSV